MSSTKMGKTLPEKQERTTKRKIAVMVMSALRRDFPKLKFADRAIRHEIDVNFDTVKKWYSGQNAPSSWHFLTLVKISPTLFDAFLHEVGRERCAASSLSDGMCFCKEIHCQKGDKAEAKNDPINDPTNTESLALTERQRWFLNEIQLSSKASIKSLMKRWGISPKTAKRDVQALKNHGLIAFTGSRKRGRYVLLRIGFRD